MEIHPQALFGHWTEGYALDFHTVSSKPAAFGKKLIDGIDPQTGLPITVEVQDEAQVTKWASTYTQIGFEMNHLKYWGERGRVSAIAAAADCLLATKENWELDLIIPVPPSDPTRIFQPVYEIARAIGDLRKLTVDVTVLKKLKSTAQMKSIEDVSQRREALAGAFDIAPNALSGRNVLLLDDLYRSGATLNEVSYLLKEVGNAKNIFVLTITKTRSKK